jgi:multiple sugar transport system ATP-binding protein
MDEPLSNLDAKLRIQTRAELIKLHRQLGITTIYVTHDQVEAMTMGQRIAIMSHGVLQQVDKPEVVYRTPANKFVAGFIGAPPMNFIDGTIQGGKINLGNMQFTIPAGHPAKGMEGKKVTFGIRPECIFVASHSQVPVTSDNSFEAKVDVVELLGHENTTYIIAGEHKLIANVDATVPIAENTVVTFAIDPDQMHIFDNETEMAIR